MDEKAKGIQRKVKGGRNAFFEHADTDRLLAMLVRFMKHHWALHERVLLLEALLEDKGLLETAATEALQPGAERAARLDQESYAFIKDVIEAAQNVDSKERAPKA